MLHGSVMWTRSRRRLAGPGRALRAALAAIMVLVGALPASSAGPAPQIEIRNHEYSPATLTIAAGTAVTWINHDDDVHTVTSTADVFHSPGIDTDETFTHTFTRPGTYEYFCKLHPLMTARVIVR